jgi:hypothetical protein
MLPAAIVAVSLAVVPMVERCRSALTQHVFVPGNDVSIALLRSELSDAGAELVALSCGSEIACAQPLRLDGLSSPHDAMDADAADVMPTVGCPPDAERQLAFSYVISPVREAVPRLPSVVIPEPCSLPSNVLDMATARMIYAALTDGTVNPRAREWRMPLVRMLVDGTPGTDFDCVYRLLLRGFGGNDERTKIRALTKWAEANLPPREAADVYRAETRYWLNLGDAVMTVDAAGRMERARPDYAVHARRLSALAHAMSGELEKAKAEIARSRAECSPMGAERHELLYLEAWIALQEGDVDLARRNLAVIVAENPRGATARKARQILESISEEAHE